MDRAILAFDRALRTLAGVYRPTRSSPAACVPEGELSKDQRAESAALMRVNHAGEICAQALYQGQAFFASRPQVRTSLQRAADEEEDHLAWCRSRIDELGGRTSVLAPLWYAGALGIGIAAGFAGERWNLAFVAETERQVEEHLMGHAARLATGDGRTLAVLEQMRRDEGQHRDMATRLGAAEMPGGIRLAMRLAARVMTSVAYRI